MTPYYERDGIMIFCGDCLEVLPGLAADSVDTCITDPPYGLSFMGQDWDHGVPGVVFWREVLRVLKPGATLLAFGGTRTFHRLACAIEDAGFELRDTIMWVYGCLSEDTEILTDKGWRAYDTLSCSSTVMCYNVDADSLEWGQVQEVYTHGICDTVYHIQSDHTDQIVTGDHRCLVERGGEYVFRRAATLEYQETIPVLESMSGLPETLPVLHQGAGHKKQVLFQEVCGTVDGSSKRWPETQETQARDANLPRLQQGVLGLSKPYQEKQDSNMQPTMQWCFEGCGVGQTRPQGARGLDRKVRTRTSQAHDGRCQPCVEGRGDILPQKRQLWMIQDQVRSLPSRVHRDGPQGWLRNGAPFTCRPSDRAMPGEIRNSTPQRPQPREQQLEQLGSIRQQQPAQETRGHGATSPTLATITPIHYEGVVWCVRVPTGAFVARRNGHIFVTGNSGFPKSANISKQIDKAAGAEREIIGIAHEKYKKQNGTTFGGDAPRAEHWNNLTAPATEAARTWDGWGTALKPSWEPIIVAMKPREGTFAQNALKWGVAGLNIDGGRIALNGESPPTGSARPGKGRGGADLLTRALGGNGPNMTSARGRWPANLIHDGSDEVTSLFPQTASGKCPHGFRGEWGANVFGKYAHNLIDPASVYGDSGSAARFFYCAKASPSERNAGLEGMETKTAAELTGRKDGSRGLSGSIEHGNSTNPYANGGGVLPRANHHPTVKPLALMQYLARLTKTPTGGVVLDPFMGSGTTGMGALLEAREFIGIELDEGYCEIARRRIAWAARQPRQRTLWAVADPAPVTPVARQATLEM